MLFVLKINYLITKYFGGGFIHFKKRTRRGFVFSPPDFLFRHEETEKQPFYNARLMKYPAELSSHSIRRDLLNFTVRVCISNRTILLKAKALKGGHLHFKHMACNNSTFQFGGVLKGFGIHVTHHIFEVLKAAF